MTQWTQKYAPKNPSDIVGRAEELRIVSEYLAGQTRKPLLLSGPPGAGKTSLIIACAQSFDIVEVNASDARNKQAILDVVGQALKQHSLFMKPRLVLVDEVDGVAGNKDRGGVVTLVNLIKETSAPMIFTANDGMKDKLKTLRKVCHVLLLNPLSNEAVLEKLNFILAQEKIVMEKETVTAIARRSGGDLRAAINDLQTVATTKDHSLDILGDRDQTAKIEDALLRVLKTTSAVVALPAFDDVPLQPNEILGWLAENLPSEYTKAQDRANGFIILAKADVFIGRIQRWQYYRFYVYIYNLLSAGVALAKDEKYPGVRAFKQSDIGLRIWIANMANAKKKIIAELIAAKTHTSTRRIMQEFPFYLRACRDPKFVQALADEFDLEKDLVTWLKAKAI